MTDTTVGAPTDEPEENEDLSVRISNALFREQTPEDQVRAAFLTFSHIAHPKKRAYLVAISFVYSITAAASAVGVVRETHYAWMKDPEFAAAFEKARLMVGERGVGAVIQRGLFGWDEPVYYEGQIVGYVRKRNDRFAEKVAGLALPELVRDRSETMHKGTIRAMAAPPWMTALTDEELESLSGRYEELRKLAEARMNPEAKALPEKSE